MRPQVVVCELLPKTKPSQKHWYAYDVYCNGEQIVANSRDPAFDAARALLAMGISGRALFLCGGKARYQINIIRAARLRTVETPRLRVCRWKAFQSGTVAPKNRKGGELVPGDNS